MKQEKLSDEEMLELETGISKNRIQDENAHLSEIDRAIMKEEDRRLMEKDIESREKLSERIDTFMTVAIPIIEKYQGLTISVDPKKICVALSNELKPIPKEMAKDFHKLSKDKITYLRSLETHIRISKLWGYIIGLSLFWLAMFFILITCLNYYSLHLQPLTTFIWTCGIMWVISLGIWIYAWHKLKME